jgi:hypothetical protein
MTGNSSRRPSALLVVGAVVVVAALSFSSWAVAQTHPHGLRLAGSVSGSTLTVKVSGHSNARCAFWLGSGKDRRRLPNAQLGERGRGRLDWSIPSSTKVGTNRLKTVCGYGGVKSSTHTSIDIPESAVSSTFTTVINLALDVFLGASLLFFFVVLVFTVVFAPAGEHFGRALALVGGALVALGAQATGVGFSEYVVESLAGAGPTGEGAKLLSIIIPGGAAVIFGWYFARATEYQTLKAMRWLVFLGMLAVVAFAVIFAEATSTQGVFLGAAAIPNTSFVVGLILSYLAFSRADDEDGRSGGLLGRLGLRSGATRTANPFAED